MKYWFLILPILMISSCSGFLSDVKLSDQLSTDEVFQTADDLEAALTGAYHSVQDGGLLGRDILLFPELMTDNVDYQPGGFTDIAQRQMDATSLNAARLWTQAYKTINHINAILQALEAVQDIGPEQAGRIEGEALFLRGVIYFELARLYCQPIGSGKGQELGLPIVLEPVLDRAAIQYPARKTIAEVYEQAIADIDEAREWLPATGSRGRANRYTAIAYLAKIAFQREDYARAAALAGELIDSSTYSLTERPSQFFTEEGSAEEIWAIFSSPGDDIDGGNLASVYHPSGFNRAFISEELKQKGFEAVVPSGQLPAIQNAGYTLVDLRADPGLLSDTPLISPDTLRTNKYENDWFTHEDDAPIARLAEFLLMRAEALARMEGVNEESIALLNRLRARALRLMDSLGRTVPDDTGLLLYKAEDFAGTEALLEAIILERRVELAFEGHYFHDLTRLKRDIKGQPYDSPRLRLPIPQREVDANPGLVQNEGY